MKCDPERVIARLLVLRDEPSGDARAEFEQLIADPSTMEMLLDALLQSRAESSALVQGTVAAGVASPASADAVAEREECALIADAYAEENIRMCTDSILNDPVLAKFRRQEGTAVTDEDVAASERFQMDGAVHSAMHHAAKNIAAAIRARGCAGG